MTNLDKISSPEETPPLDTVHLTVKQAENHISPSKDGVFGVMPKLDISAPLKTGNARNGRLLIKEKSLGKWLDF